MISKLLFKLINPPIKLLLNSPFHPMMSGNTLLLEFTGRKSGRALSTPISYHIADGKAHCFTSKPSKWWRNLIDNAAVHITVKGVRTKTHALVEIDDHIKIAEALRVMLITVPRDASHAGVKLDSSGLPDEDDLNRVAPDMVYLSFPIESG